MTDPLELDALRRRGTFRLSPPSRDDVRVQRFGAERDSPVHFFMFRDVLDELSFAAGYRSRPAYAALTGGFGVESGMGFVEVSGFENLVYPEPEDDPVEEYIETARQVGQQPGNDVIVGLFVAAPGSNGLITEQAAHLHMSLFNVPFQPLVVVDAEADVLAVYGRAPRRTFVDAPLYVVSPIDAHETDSA